MKKLLLFFFITFIGSGIFAENGKPDVKVYAGSGGASLDGEAVVSLDVKLAYSALPWLNIGVQGTAYHTLEREYRDADGNSYQAESGLIGFFIQPHWSLTERLEVGIKVTSGMQTIQVRYMGDLRDTLVYYEEYPDKLYVPYNDLGLTLEYSLCPDHSLLLEAGFRNVHPAKSPYLDEEVNGTFFGGIFYGFNLN